MVSRLGGEPRFHKALLIAQVASMLAAESAERGRAIVLVVDLCSRWDYAALWAASVANIPEPASFGAGLREG